MASTTNPLADDLTPQAETEAEHAARLARERALLNEGFEDIRAGRALTGAELDAWLNRFAQGLPPASPTRDAG
jgi:hypothetical protein